MASAAVEPRFINHVVANRFGADCSHVLTIRDAPDYLGWILTHGEQPTEAAMHLTLFAVVKDNWRRPIIEWIEQVHAYEGRADG